jgi:predicted signal transduction protein with EAL and GGDEF domain
VLGLTQQVRETDTVARLGGDEFTLLVPGISAEEDAAKIARKICEAIHDPFWIDGRELFVTTSVGVSVYPSDGHDGETLVRNADSAMYRAKEQGRDNYQLFNAFVNAKSNRWIVFLTCVSPDCRSLSSLDPVKWRSEYWYRYPRLNCQWSGSM